MPDTPKSLNEIPERLELPVDSFKDAAPFLRRPFTPAAVKFKVQATWPKDTPTGGLIVAYIDARLAIERLNRVCPHLWTDAYTPIGNRQMWCHLTVDDITRHDVGEGEGKGLVSDALKRAAVKFGVGVSLYAIPKMILSTEDGTVKQKRTKDGLTLEITPKGEKQLRAVYAQWLDLHGSEAFGVPLDHGDLDGAQGDHEVETPEPASVVPAAKDEDPKPIGEGPAAALILNADSAGILRDDLRKAVQHATGRIWPEDAFDDDVAVLEVVAGFSVAQQNRLDKWIERKREAAQMALVSADEPGPSS